MESSEVLYTHLKRLTPCYLALVKSNFQFNEFEYTNLLNISDHSIYCLFGQDFSKAFAQLSSMSGWLEERKGDFPDSPRYRLTKQGAALAENWEAMERVIEKAV